jgi:hypothetical protein
VLLPNEMQISCKRPEKTYVPQRGSGALPRAELDRFALVGCICGLDGQGNLLFTSAAGGGGSGVFTCQPPLSASHHVLTIAPSG